MGTCHPDDPPKGYHTAARGQSWQRRRQRRRRLPTRGRVVGQRQVDGMALASRGSPVGHRVQLINLASVRTH
jgi:hypothetical protein